VCSDRTALRIIALIASAGFLCSCTPAPRPIVQRIAVLPLENLTGDPGLAWVGPALAAVIASEAEGRQEQFVFYAPTYGEAVNRRAALVVDGHFSECLDGLAFRFDVEDLRSSRIVRRLERRAPVEALIEVARQAGEELSTQRRLFPTTNLEALRYYAQAMTLDDPQLRQSDLESALRQDPAFHDARFLLADLLLSTGDTPAARRVVAEDPGAGLDEISSARLQLLQARLSRGRKEVADALEKLSRLLPADAETAARTAQEFLSLYDYAKAAEWYGRAAETDPDNPGWWNSRAYAAAYAGDPEAAFDSLERYRAADADTPNSLDSYGEICFRFGRLEEAEKHFLAAYEQDPGFLGGAPLLKAAWCRLFGGDRKGADELFQRYARTARDLGDPRIGLDEARWRYWTGRRAEAVRALQRAVEQPAFPRRFLAEAHVQLAVWRLLAGDAAQARNHLREAARLAGGRLVGPDALLAWSLAADSGRRGPPETPVERLRLLARAYGCLLYGKPAAAAAPLRRIYETSPPLERDLVAVLLAWAEIEAGRAGDAQRLLEPNPIWQPRTESAFHSLIFPRIFYLRGLLAARADSREAAVRNLRLFLDYSGDIRDVTAHEETARRLLDGLGAGGGKPGR